MSDEHTLPDGTQWSLKYMYRDGPGGQHVGVEPPWVVLHQGGRELALCSGLRSSHRAKQAVLSCSHWSEVPLAIEATGWTS